MPAIEKNIHIFLCQPQITEMLRDNFRQAFPS